MEKDLQAQARTQKVYGAMEWQVPKRNTYAHGWSRGINTGNAGNLESWVGSVDILSVEYGR